ncbi:(d)CMP kinase [Rubripirellula amarantea]|nr:(d)CMP kinase [Rubripirellula amarantea]MDA8743332.1 (d)CMP kinase [Rubripirellula amarantea]
MIVTIDGPAGAGKSSIARQVAQSIGFDFLDTGAMYRAVTLGAIREQIEWDDLAGLIAFTKKSRINFDCDRVFLNDVDVTEEIRSPTVTSAIRYLADVAEVREELSNQQRIFAENRNLVTDGRDQGTEVFPNATCKIFLTASPDERARRRQAQLQRIGRFMPLDEILAAQRKRDAEDKARPMGALRPADDAIVVDSDGMTTDEVLRKVLQIIQQVMQSQSAAQQ